MLSDILKKTVWMGIGAVSLTEKKAREIVSGLVEKKEVTEKEGEKLVEQLVKEGEKAKKDAESFIEKKVHAIVERLELATKADIEDLKKKIDALAEKQSQ